MKRLLLIVLSLVISKVEAEVDHLTPQRGVFGLNNYFLEYYKNVRDILLPEWEPSMDVLGVVFPYGQESVLRISKNENGDYSITYTEVNGTIWNNDDINYLDVRLYKETIDKGLVQDLLTIWQQILRSVKVASYDPAYSTDSSPALFYCFIKGEGPLEGQMPRNPTKRLSKLLVICDQLKLYAMNPEHRDRLLEKIRSEVEKMKSQ